MQHTISLLVSLGVLIFLLLPFFMGPGGSLASASAINDVKKLEKLKQGILRRYLEEEHAMNEGDITETQWMRRKTLLSNRYIDVSKRLDFLTGGGER